MKRIIIEILKKHLDKPYWGDEEGKYPDGNVIVTTPLDVMCDSREELLSVAEEIIIAMWGTNDVVKIPSKGEALRWAKDHAQYFLGDKESHKRAMDFADYLADELVEWLKSI